jgi:hypothetical protein
MSSWARAGRLRRTRDAYKAQGVILTGATLLAMVVAVAGCGVAVAATNSLAVGAIVGAVLYFWLAGKMYRGVTGDD